LNRRMVGRVFIPDVHLAAGAGGHRPDMHLLPVPAGWGRPVVTDRQRQEAEHQVRVRQRLKYGTREPIGQHRAGRAATHDDHVAALAHCPSLGVETFAVNNGLVHPYGVASCVRYREAPRVTGSGVPFPPGVSHA